MSTFRASDPGVHLVDEARRVVILKKAVTQHRHSVKRTTWDGTVLHNLTMGRTGDHDMIYQNRMPISGRSFPGACCEDITLRSTGIVKRSLDVRDGVIDNYS